MCRGDQEGRPGNALSSVDSHTPAACQLYKSLTAQHSGISNDILLFSEVGVFASSLLSRAQSGPASCYVSWEIFGAAARSPTGEHYHADSRRAIRPCLFFRVVHGRPDGWFRCYASATWTSTAAGKDHGYACTDRASAYGAGPADGSRGRGVWLLSGIAAGFFGCFGDWYAGLRYLLHKVGCCPSRTWAAILGAGGGGICLVIFVRSWVLLHFWTQIWTTSYRHLMLRRWS